MENYELEQQLIIRASHSAYFTREVLSKGIPSLIQDKTLSLIAKTLLRYYGQHDEAITEKALNLLLEQRLKLQAKQAGQQIPDQILDQLFQKADKLLNTPEDESEVVTTQIENYIHTQLANDAILEEASKGDTNIGERVAKRLNTINDISLTGTQYKPLNMLSDIDERLAIYDKFNQRKIKSGLSSFDRVTGGGLELGQVSLFGAKSGGGKSTLLTNLTYYYAMQGGNNVLHVTLEELEQDQVLRFDRIMLNAGIKEVFDTQGQVNPEYISKLQSYYHNLANTDGYGDVYFKKSTPLTLKVDDLKQMILSVERVNDIKIAVVVLDYAALLKRQEYSDSESKAGELLFQDLVKLAQQTDTLIITATQLNRGASIEDVATLANVEGSYRKINTVAFACTLNSKGEEKDKGYVRWYIDKVRNGYWKDDDFLYFRYDLKSFKLNEETPQEQEEHKMIVSSDLGQRGKNNNQKQQSIPKDADLGQVINNAIKGV